MTKKKQSRLIAASNINCDLQVGLKRFQANGWPAGDAGG
jgi:hypothetical protein